MITLETIKDVGELEPLASCWDNLLKRSGSDNIFLTWDWIYNCVKTYAAKRRLLTIIAYKKGKLAAICPFWVNRVRIKGIIKMKRLEFIGSGDLCADYLDLIVVDKNRPALVEAVWDHLHGPLRREWDLFEYHHVPDSSKNLKYLLFLTASPDRCFRSEIEGLSICPFIRLPASWEEYKTGLSSCQRRNLRISLERLSESGTLEYKKPENDDDLAREFDNLIDLNRKSWSDRGDTGSFSTPEFENFHRTFARVLIEKDKLILRTLLLDGNRIGVFYGFEHNRILYYYIIGVERSPLKRVSVGRVLLAHVIREAIEKNHREFDFLRGDEDYKYDWTGRYRVNILTTFYNPKLNTIIFLILRTIKNIVKQTIKAVAG